jgi:hypothetical protein
MAMADDVILMRITPVDGLRRSSCCKRRPPPRPSHRIYAAEARIVPIVRYLPSSIAIRSRNSSNGSLRTIPAACRDGECLPVALNLKQDQLRSWRDHLSASAIQTALLFGSRLANSLHSAARELNSS